MAVLVGRGEVGATERVVDDLDVNGRVNERVARAPALVRQMDAEPREIGLAQAEHGVGDGQRGRTDGVIKTHDEMLGLSGDRKCHSSPPPTLKRCTNHY